MNECSENANSGRLNSRDWDKVNWAGFSPYNKKPSQARVVNPQNAFSEFSIHSYLYLHTNLVLWHSVLFSWFFPRCCQCVVVWCFVYLNRKMQMQSIFQFPLKIYMTCNLFWLSSLPLNLFQESQEDYSSAILMFYKGWGFQRLPRPIRLFLHRITLFTLFMAQEIDKL